MLWGEYVPLNVPPLCFSLLNHTSVCDWREADLRLQDKRMEWWSTIKPPPRRQEERRMRGVGVPSRVLRCRTHLDRALAGVETVDFFLLYCFPITFREKRHANIGAAPLKSLVRASRKGQGTAWKSDSLKVLLPHGPVIVAYTATCRAFCPLAKLWKDFILYFHIHLDKVW